MNGHKSVARHRAHETCMRPSFEASGFTRVEIPRKWKRFSVYKRDTKRCKGYNDRFHFLLFMGYAQRRRRHYAAEHLNLYTEMIQLTEAFERKHSKNPQVRTYSFKVWQKGSCILGCY